MKNLFRQNVRLYCKLANNLQHNFKIFTGKTFNDTYSNMHLFRVASLSELNDIYSNNFNENSKFYTINTTIEDRNIYINPLDNEKKNLYKIKIDDNATVKIELDNNSIKTIETDKYKVLYRIGRVH